MTSVFVKMGSSWDLGRQDFYATITSTSNSELFRDNHPGEFQAQFHQNIILDPEQWEVALADIQYVRDFPNIGDDTFLKIRHRREVFTLGLPQGYCKKLGDLASFLSVRINDFFRDMYASKQKQQTSTGSSEMPAGEAKAWFISQEVEAMFHGSVVRKGGDGGPRGRGGLFHHQHSEVKTPEDKTRFYSKRFNWSVKPPSISIELDSLDRVKIRCDSKDFDIGFSDVLLDILGLYDERDLTLESFDARSLFWELIEEESKAQGRSGDTLFFFGRMDAHAEFRKYFRPEMKMMGCSSLRDLKMKITMVLGFEPSNQKILMRFLRKFPRDFESFRKSGYELKSMADTWPGNSDAEKYLHPNEYRSFLLGCESVTPELKPSEKSFVKEGGGFSLLHGYYFLLYILKKILFGTVSDSLIISKNPGRINVHELMYIYSDLIKPEPFNEMMSRILISFQNRKGNNGERVTFSPNPRQYKALEKGNISNMKMLIAGERGERIPFQRGPTNITLHFRQIQ